MLKKGGWSLFRARKCLNLYNPWWAEKGPAPLLQHPAKVNSYILIVLDSCLSAIPSSAPDLIIGYIDGYRTSWDAAAGSAGACVIEDNTRQRSGDRSIDPPRVLDVLFCNRAVSAQDPGSEDLAPTALERFGIATPEWMEGKPVFASA